jgi:putative acetyltransferase
LARSFTSPYAGPHLMALALTDGGLPTLTGEIAYARAFAALQ